MFCKSELSMMSLGATSLRMDATEGKLGGDGAASPPSPQATRVESLFHLVKEGSCVEVRENAAEKLGEIALQSPVYCKSILRQIRRLLVDTQWDVRVAAAKCLDVLARSFRNDPLVRGTVAVHFARASFAGREASCPRLNFRTVDLDTVLRDGAPLLRSGGEEYAYETDLSDEQRKRQAVRQRQLLLRRICGSGGSTTDGMWKTGEDALAQQMLPRLNSEHVKELADDIEASELLVQSDPPLVASSADDARKRAAEMLPEQHRTAKKPKTDEGEVASSAGDDRETQAVDIVAFLVADLFESIFDATWEVRHGGFAALRHILLSSGWLEEGVAGTTDAGLVDQWIEECLVRCLCVLALDQFVDYSADGSVAPVRELTAQVFGILLGSLHDEQLLQEYLSVLRKLLGSPSSWHASHGGLLGIKYLLQAHAAHASALVSLVVEDVVDILEVKRRGAEEDVLIVASAILGDIVQHLSPPVSNSTIHRASQSLWAIATGERSFVASATIQTLRLWYEHAPVAEMLRSHPNASLLWERIARIVPLLHHHDKAVRVSTATCIRALVSQGDGRLFVNESPDTVQHLLSRLLLQLLRDEFEDARSVVLLTWAAVVEWCSGTHSLVELIDRLLPQWIEIVWTLDSVSVLYFARANDEDDVADFSSILLPSKDNIAARVSFAEALGLLMSHVPPKSEAYQAAIKQITQGINSLSGEQQCGSLLLLYWWAVHTRNRKGWNDLNLLAVLRDHVGEIVEALAQRNWVSVATSSDRYYYSEQAASLQRVLRMERRLIELFETSSISVKSIDPPSSTGSCATVSRQVAERVAQYPFTELTKDPQAFEQAHFGRQDLFLLDDVIQRASSRMYARIQGLGSCVFGELLEIPTKKSGFLVSALMASLKTEETPAFRALTAETLAHFVVSQVDVQRKCVNKIVSNLCNSAVALAYRETDDEVLTGDNDDALQLLQVRIQGAQTALQAIAQAVGSLDSLPMLAQVFTRGWSRDDGNKWSDKLIQENAHLVSVLLPSLRANANPLAIKWMEDFSDVIDETFKFERTRKAVANAIAHICGTLSTRQEGEKAMVILYRRLFSARDPQDSDLPSTLSVKSRHRLAGSIMVLDRLIVEMGAQLTAFVPSFLHFAMRAMHAADSSVRSMAAKAFADLLPLMPLQMDLTGVEGQCHPQLRQVLQENQSSRAFLESLLQGKAIASVSLRDVLAESFALRDYQQHGVNWLKFLVDNQMGGVLADDMGLGKTVQVLAAVATTVSKKKISSSISLVVCPPIIVHHWIIEAKRCFPTVFTDVVDYSGPAAKRKAMLAAARKSTSGAVLLVTTYSAVRSDREILRAFPFEFIVLDEAHLIRNPKSSLFDAVCSLQASHRFVLSGTPLQNHVGDLWALFNFLMPGYLGDYAEFRREFELPISSSRERNATPKQKELAAHAINTLHQRVLPFILRRTKDDVLKELPPKIVSNILLPLTALQQRLYKAASSNSDGNEATGGPLPGVLRQLQLLKKICVHPALVKEESVMTEASATEQKSLSNWKHSGKMVGLHDLLVESCDMGRENGDFMERGSHRCLVFAHLTETLDMVQDMLAQALPSVTSLRLDGKTPSSKRHDIVAKFNDDPSIDLLLLTTAVGGLGLTLTGADTVIFVEHSWNPFVDLQAMDRAHRIGQKKTVRVFRLIMEASLEEHIMDLQAFKEQVAQTVVTSTEASTSMNASTANVLHLLKTSSTAIKAQEAAAAAHAQVQARKAKGNEGDSIGIPGAAVELLSQLGELWDQSQYDSLAFPSTH